MTWPDDVDLPIEVWAAFGADPNSVTGGEVLTDLSDRLMSNPIPYRVGATAGGTTQPSQATVHLLNDDGALTPLYAQSEHWPNVVVGTPIWVPLRRVEDAFGRTVSSGWGTSDSGQSWVTVGGSSSDYSTNGSVGRHSHSTINVLRRTRLNDVSLLDTHQTVDASTSVLITGAALVTGVIARYDGSGPTYYWCRTEFNAGSTTVMLKITRVVSGVMTDLGSVAAVSGLAYAANTPLRTRVSVVGDRISMKTWTASNPEPDGWHLEATDPDPITAPGSCGIESWVVSGNTNVAPVVAAFDNYAVRVDVVNGFADSWVPTVVPDSDGTVHSAVRVTVSGILRRLEQDTDSRSPLTRFLPGTDPIAWWPLEDGVDSTQAASGLVGGTPLTVASGIMDFTDDAPPGASGSAHPDPSAANALTGTIAGGSETAWQISIWSKGEIATEGIDAYYVAWEIVTTTGQVLRLAHQYEIDEAIGVAHWTSLTQTTPTNTVIMMGDADTDYNPGITGDWMQVTCTFQQVGADCNVWLDLDEVTVASGTWSGVTIGAPRDIAAISPFGAGNATSLNMRNIWLSQIVLHNTATVVAQHSAGQGFPGETVSDRAARVCGERGIPIYIEAGDSELLGRQPTGTDLDVLRDGEVADVGILYERGWGLGYRPRVTLYNQDPTLTIDLTEFMHSRELRPEQVLAPTYDDKAARNDVTVSRRDGSSHRSVDDAHIARHGRRRDKVEVGLADDSQLEPQSGWRLHLGTWQEMRYPGVPVDLAGNPELIEDWLRMRVGARVRQTNVPAPHPPDDVEQLAIGWSGTLTRRGWSGTVVGTPARPWNVGVWNDTGSRWDTSSSTLTGSITTGTTTTFQVTIGSGGSLWINPASHLAQFPIDIETGGATLRVLSTGQALNDDPSFETSSAGWSANPGATIAHSTAQAHTGTGSMLITPDGVTATTGAAVTATAQDAVSAAATYLLVGWFRCTVALTDARMAVDWYQSNGTTFISSGLPSPIAVSPFVWTPYSATVTAPALSAFARLRVRIAGTPTGLVWADDCMLIPTSTYTASPQHMTVLQTPVNGITKTVAAGTSVRLANPARWAL